jgi:hypothetical protein
VIAQETIDGARNWTVDESPLGRLRRAFPWPAAKPDVESSTEHAGWLGDGTDQALTSVLSDRTQVVVELGAWLGMSTRFIAEKSPHATVVSVDHWQGSPEHRARAEFRSILPTLYETFLAQCWSFRDRIVPLRMSTLEGLRTVARFGIDPDVIYIDAEHSYEAVTSELELASELFPRARLIGDDFDWRGVREAAQNFARRNGQDVERFGGRGWSIVNRLPASSNGSATRTRAIVLVPHLSGIDAPCEQGLRDLELAGIRVIRRQGSSLIDFARSEMISEALHDGYDAMLFIDADIGFEADAALRLLQRPEPVVSGVYAKKGPREVASVFVEGTTNILFGPEAPGLYPLRYAATGFLRIRAEVLRLMIERLQLPLCNTVWGRGVWPFFMPLIVREKDNHYHYLGEDWAFSHRLNAIGVRPMADTSIRLYHYGPYGYSWEDVGSERSRFQSYNLSFG